MSTEVPRPNNEAPKSVGFYNPITDHARTLGKLTALSKKEPADVELFEAISDTFATMATIDFEAGVAETVGDQKFKAGEWQHTDEVICSTEKFNRVFIGYYRLEGNEVIGAEEAFMEWHNGADDTKDITLIFQRDTDGSVKVVEYDAETDEDHPHQFLSDQRKLIIETLLKGMNSQQLVTA